MKKLTAFLVVWLWSAVCLAGGVSVMVGGGVPDAGEPPAGGTVTALTGTDAALISLSSTATWETADLDSTYGSLPSPASMAILVAVNDSGTSYNFGVRENGDTDFTITSDVVGRNRTTVYVKPDSGNVIQIYRESVDLDVYLIGYADGANTWIGAPTDVTPGTANSYQDIDLSAYAGASSVWAILEVDTPGTRAVSFRYNGDTTIDYSSESYSGGHHWAIAPLDGSDIIEAEVENITETTIYVVGFIDVGTVKTTASSDLAPATQASYQTITVPDGGHDIAVLGVFDVTAAAFAFRPYNDTSYPDIYHDSDGTGNYTISAIDGSNRLEGKFENAGTTVHVFGYLD